MAKKPSPRQLSSTELVALHLSALADGKKFYKEADAALEALLKQAKVGEVIALPVEKPIPVGLRGKKFAITDKFEKRNSIGVGLSARRYELEEVTQP